MPQSTNDLHYFPRSYSDSRSRFRNLLIQNNNPRPFETGTWALPSQTDNDLTIDFGYLPPSRDSNRLVVLSSGVHGLEGYAGSAIQQMFLQELLPQLDQGHTGIFIIHALNPWGFRHHRRCTENHVNLNRNCSVNPKALFSIKNQESLLISDQFIPKQPVESTQSFLTKTMSRSPDNRIFFNDVGMDELVKAIGLGQFESPQGLEFGGKNLEPQIEYFIEKMSAILPAYDEIILLDLHTGLGDRGRLHVLTGDHENSVDAALYKKIWGDQPHPEFTFTPANDEGFYKTHGAINNIFPEIAKPAQRICALTMEFGTLGHDQNSLIDGLERWFLEHQGLFYGFKNTEIERLIRSNYLEKFAPENPEWRTKVIQGARVFLSHLTESQTPRQD